MRFYIELEITIDPKNILNHSVVRDDLIALTNPQYFERVVTDTAVYLTLAFKIENFHAALDVISKHELLNKSFYILEHSPVVVEEPKKVVHGGTPKKRFSLRQRELLKKFDDTTWREFFSRDFYDQQISYKKKFRKRLDEHSFEWAAKQFRNLIFNALCEMKAEKACKELFPED